MGFGNYLHALYLDRVLLLLVEIDSLIVDLEGELGHGAALSAAGRVSNRPPPGGRGAGGVGVHRGGLLGAHPRGENLLLLEHMLVQ